MDKLESVLVGVDFTPGSAAALRQAVRLAAWNRSMLRALHVIDTLVVVDLEEALSEFQADIQRGLIRDVHRLWEKFYTPGPGAAPLPLEVVIGNEAQSIFNAQKKYQADLLVMGVHGAKSGSSSVSRSELGSGELAKACVRRAECAVLLVDDTHVGPFKSIVVGMDFSPTSILALRAAFRVAVQDGAALHVVHVFEPPWRRLHYFAPIRETSPEFQEKYRAALLGRLQGVVNELGHDATYLKPTFHLVEHASDGRGLTEFARTAGADLLVMGTRGRSDLADVVLGSTAERVLRHAPCSMLTVRADSE